MSQPEMQVQETETMTYREAIRQALREELDRDEDVFIMGEDIAVGGGVFEVTQGLLDEFGEERVRDTPISEAALAGVSTGAAMAGKRPVVEIMFADFLGVCMEQITNQMAKNRYMFGGGVSVPVTIRTTEGAGMSAGAQHSSSYHTWLAHLPGIKAVSPGSPAAAKGLLKSAIRSDDPIVFFENKTIYAEDGPVPTDDEFTIPIGEASVERSGEDITVVASQRLVQEALDVADDIAAATDVEVIDLRSYYPMDFDTIASSVQKTGRLVIADESTLSYGTHAEIAARVLESEFYSLDAPVQRVGVPDTHMPFNPELEIEVLPFAEDIRSAIERIV